MKHDFEESCSLCEYGQEIFEGEYYICKKKGVMEPSGICKSFCFDPLKIKVSVRKIPKFVPLEGIADLGKKEKEAK